MKIKVELTIELEDPNDWDLTFSIGSNRKDIREDVKQYVLYNLHCLGVFGNGECPAKITLNNP